jgi:hypothetical protein
MTCLLVVFSGQQCRRVAGPGHVPNGPLSTGLLVGLGVLAGVALLVTGLFMVRLLDR